MPDNICSSKALQYESIFPESTDFCTAGGSSMFSKHLYISSHITDLAITKSQWYLPHKGHRPLLLTYAFNPSNASKDED